MAIQIAKSNSDSGSSPHGSKKGTGRRAVIAVSGVGLLSIALLVSYGTTLTNLQTRGARCTQCNTTSAVSYFRGGGSSHQENGDGINRVPPIEVLTKSHIQEGIECPYPLVPFYDRIVDNPTPKRIPKNIHLAWVRGQKMPNGQGRCITQDMMEIPQRWAQAFPSYNIYFHYDDAVDALFAQPWPEFPAINKFMDACVKFGSAMRIDIWRQLVLYRYGGIYSDFDVAPGPDLSENTIHPNDSAVFSSDAWNRPSQWFMSMAPKHPIAYYTMNEIMKRLWELADVSNVKVVFTTGPDLLKHGFWTSLVTAEPYETVFTNGLHNTTLYDGPIRKLPMKGYAGGYDDTPVPYPRNHSGTEDYINITKKERVHKEMNTVHWKTLHKQTRHEKPNGKCMHYLYWHDWNATQVMDKDAGSQASNQFA